LPQQQERTEHEWLDPEGILKYSDNIGSARIALQLGSQRLSQAILRYGFAERSGIDFPTGN
jgi:cell division protein FtsI/penicillin-binding protein 2